MPTKTEAIQNFLTVKTHADLAHLYNYDMECQVNVAQDGGERIDGDYKGRKWHGWSDSVTTWKSFRIPYKANSVPEYNDYEIKFDLAAHAEAIGMTGWDWKNRVSKWVAYDFDSITGHSEHHTARLTNEELSAVRDAVSDIKWVTVRRSTGGNGLHLYVDLEDVPTSNHTEHAALARSILGKMSAITGFDFESKVDVCGGNMWVWHRKMVGTQGLTVIKQGNTLHDIPPNWRDHVKVITGSRRKNLPQDITGSRDEEDLFTELTGQRQNIPLDPDHKTLIEWLRQNEALWWWDQDHHMLVTHTHYLECAHRELDLKGFFKSVTDAKNLNEQNCFLFPLRKGAWGVRRYGIGVQEHESWNQDGAGWTRCYYNREPDLMTAARAHGGLEDPKGGFIFREASVAEQASQLLGVHLKVGLPQKSRETKMKQHKDGRLLVEVERKEADMPDTMVGWLPQGKKWTKMFNATMSAETESDVGNYDDLVRHLVTETSEDCGWMIKADGYWRAEPLAHIRVALQSLNLNNKEVTGIIGQSIFKCWRVVNKPFQPEYPGDREWNRNAAQLKYLPSKDLENLKHPTWDSLLLHCGSGLDEAVKHDGWCKANGLTKGADYLKCWIASVFQQPLEPLPYLFMYGPQNSGKSIYHEALSTLLTKGSKRADAALISQAGFNGELEGAIICVVEETDLKKNQMAYNRIKDWVTSREINIHGKGKTPYHIPNATHWIQCANDHQACPIFTGDTRITMCYVEPLNPIDLIPKREFIILLEKEAPDFMADVMNLEIPRSSDRLHIPVLNTADKSMLQQLNQSELESFITDKCVSVDGHKIKFSDFYEKFVEFIDPNEIHHWSKIRVGRELPPHHPKGRRRKDAQHYIGNIAWGGHAIDGEKLPKLILKDEYLEPVDANNNA